MEELGGGDDDNSSSNKLKPSIPDTLIQRSGEDKLLSHDLSYDKEKLTGVIEDGNRTNDSTSDPKNPAKDQIQYPNNPESPNGASFIAASYENQSNYNSLSNTPSSPHGANFVSLDNSDNQSNHSRHSSPGKAVGFTSSSHDVDSHGFPVDFTTSTDSQNHSHGVGPNTPPDRLTGPDAEDTESKLIKFDTLLTGDSQNDSHGSGPSTSPGLDSDTESKRIKFEALFPGGATRLSPPGSCSTPRVGSAPDDFAYSDSELLNNEAGGGKGGPGSFADDRSLLSLPSMDDSEDGDMVGELAGAHFNGVPGRSMSVDAAHFAAERAEEEEDDHILKDGRSMSVDAAHFAAERAEEEEEEERWRQRALRFRKVLARRAKIVKVNPRTSARMTNKRTINNIKPSHTRNSLSKPDRPSRDEVDRPKREAGPSSESSEEPFSLWRVSRHDKLLLLALFLVDLSVFMSLSIMAPFFPQEAAAKGLSPTVSGWVFGVFALVQCIMSPIFGLLIPQVGPRFLFLAGQFFAGGCSILFGLLTYVPTEPSNTVYISLCFTLRVCLAMGCTASSTASFATTATRFSDGATQVFGILEMGAGLGLMAGPALGGVLYQYGGFAAPFASLGIFLLLTVPVNFHLLPPDTHPDPDDSGPGVSMFHMLSIPAIAVVALATFVGSVMWSIMDPTLAPHFEVFGLSPSMLGLVFLLMSTFYAISAPFWGWLCDKIKDSSPMLCVGFACCSVGFLLLGPSPLLGFEKDYNVLWLNLVSLGILGLSASLAIIPTYDKLLDAAEKAGIEEGIEMYSVIAGLWSSAYALGDFAGPTLGGMLLERVGFPYTMTYTAIACAAMSVIILVLWIVEWRTGPSQPLSCRCRRRRRKKPELSSIEDGVRTANTNERTPLLSERA